MSDYPKKLYKYQSFEDQYSLINLINRQVYFQDPNNFNDPFDCTLSPIVLNIKEKDFKIFYESHQKEGKKMSFEEFKNILSEDSSFLIDSTKNLMKNFYERRPILSLSQIFNSILMWSYYTNKHKGFCLGFDTNYEPFKKTYKVIYRKEFPSIKLLDLILPENREVDKTIKPLITKFRKWKHEKEFRGIHIGNPTHYLYDKKALTDVYLGMNISELHTETLKKIVSEVFNNRVNIWKARLPQKKYKIEFDLIQTSS